MRPIKFRGKVLHQADKLYIGSIMKDGEWVYGDLHLLTPNPHIHEKIHKEPIDTNTIGQFTGLQDKNGKDIYEGDILEYIDSACNVSRRVVVFKDGAFCQEISFTWLKPIYNPLKNHQLEIWEVIGNIHDNPELLKRDEE